MGGFNIGELFGALKLDDSQFREALERSVKTAELFNINIDKIGGSVRNLAFELTKAGFSLQGVQGWLNSLRRQGKETDEAVQELTASIGKLQSRAATLHATDIQNIVRGPATGKDWTAAQEAERNRVVSLLNRAKFENTFDDDARRRQKEIEGEMLGHVSYLERIQKEARDKVIAAERTAYAERLRMFQEHRRQMQISQAATVIGTTAVGIGGVGVAAGALVAKDAINFQDAMTKSLAVVGAVSEQTRDIMSQTARSAAKETGIAVTQIAEDYAIMAKGGLTAAESIDLLPKVSRFAVATDSDLHNSTRQIITVMEALQIPVKNVDGVMNQLTVANQLARGSVEQLATALEGRSGAALRNAHVSLEQALALTIAFSKAGVTASQSQTFLTQIIERLGSAARLYGEELINVGDKQMKFHDIVYLANGSTRPFIDTLKLLDQAFKGRSAEQIGKFFDDIHLGSARGSQGLKILLSQSELLDQLAGRIQNVGDAVQQAFDKQLESPKRQLAILKANLVDIAITIGIPLVAALQSAVNACKPLFQITQDLAAKFAELPKPIQESILLLGAVGSMALVAGGGLLIMLGHVVRLQADLKLLAGTEGLVGMLGTLGSVASAFVAVSVAIGATALAIQHLKDITKESASIGSGTGVKGALLGGSMAFLRAAIPSQLLPGGGSSGAGTSGQAQGDPLKSSMDSFRKMLAELRKGMQEAFDNSTLAIDPKKLEKQFLNAENFQTAARKFQDDYQKTVESLSSEQDQSISEGIYKLRKLSQSGADKARLDAALSALRVQLEEYKSLNSERIKQSEEARAITDQNIDAELKHGLSAIALRKDALVKARAVTEEDVAIRALQESELARQSNVLSVNAVNKRLSLLHDENNKEIVERLKLQEQKVQLADELTKELQTIQEKADNETAQIQQQRIERAQQKELSGEIQQQARLANVRRQNAQIQLGFGDITGEQFIATQRKIDAEEIVTQSNAIRRQLSLLDATKAYNKDYRAQRESLMSELGRLDTEFYGREQEYQAQERRGFNDVTQAISEQVAEQKRLLQQPNRGGQLFDLSNARIQTAALKAQQEGFLGIAATVKDKVIGSFNNLGTTLVGTLVKMRNLGETMKEFFQGAIINIFGTALQKVFELLAAKALTSLGIIKLAAAASGAARINDEAAVGGAATAASIAAIPVVGPGLAVEAGTAMYGSILATFLPYLAAGSMDNGGVVQKTAMHLMHADEYVINRDLTKSLTAMAQRGSMGGGPIFDLRGAYFGAGTDQASINRMGNAMVGKLRRKGAKL